MYTFIKESRFPILFLFLTLIFFYKILIHPNEMLHPAGDMSIYAFKEWFLVDSIKNFQIIPFWNPYMFGGHPTLGSSEIPLFYPLHILFFFLPIDPTFGYLFILDIFLLGIFTYLFTRRINLDSLSASISAIIAMFSGTTILYIYPGQISILDGFIYLPLLLLFCELIIQKKSFIYTVFLGASIGFMLLSGTLQISLINLLTVFSYFIFRLIFIKKDKIKLIFMPFISVIIGILLASIQLIPGLEFVRFSTRASGLSYSFASDFSLHPYQLITFFLPHFFGSPIVNNTYWGINGNFWSLCGYVGVFPLILSIVAILYKRNKYTFFFTCIGIFSLLFSFGRFGFMFPFFYDFVPGFNFFRVPARFLFIYSFSIAILSGIGVSMLINNPKLKFLSNVLKSLATLLLISGGFYLYIYYNKQNFIHFLNSKGYALGNNLDSIYSLIVKDLGVLTLLVLFSFLLLSLKMKGFLTKRIFFLLASFIILFDLWIFDFKFYNTKNPKEVFRNSAEIDQIVKDKTTFRVFDFKGYAFPLTGRNRIESLTGFDALYLSYYRDFLWLTGDHTNTPHESFFTFYNIRNLNILRLLNTKYILANEIAFVFDRNSVIEITPNLYEIKETMPRAYIVPKAIVIREQNKIFDTLKNPNFDPKQTIILDKDPKVAIKNTSSFTPVKTFKRNPNNIKLSVSLSDPGFLVLSEIWYPGWKAFVNGEETQIYIANSIFRSIYLDKGLKNVTFIFDPLSYKIGKLTSVSSVIIILIYISFYIKSNKLKLK